MDKDYKTRLLETLRAEREVAEVERLAAEAKRERDREEERAEAQKVDMQLALARVTSHVSTLALTAAIGQKLRGFDAQHESLVLQFETLEITLSVDFYDYESAQLSLNFQYQEPS